MKFFKSLFWGLVSSRDHLYRSCIEIYSFTSHCYAVGEKLALALRIKGQFKHNILELHFFGVIDSPGRILQLSLVHCLAAVLNVKPLNVHCEV